MTDTERWIAVDQYITDSFVRPDPALDAALRAPQADAYDAHDKGSAGGGGDL